MAFIAILILVAGAGAFVWYQQQGLSDAEVSWCKSNLSAVVDSANSLNLPVPAGSSSWLNWATPIAYGKGIVNDPWNYFTPEGDRTNRDRACKAAFDGR